MCTLWDFVRNSWSHFSWNRFIQCNAWRYCVFLYFKCWIILHRLITWWLRTVKHLCIDIFEPFCRQYNIFWRIILFFPWKWRKTNELFQTIRSTLNDENGHVDFFREEETFPSDTYTEKSLKFWRFVVVAGDNDLSRATALGFSPFELHDTWTVKTFLAILSSAYSLLLSSNSL